MAKPKKQKPLIDQLIAACNSLSKSMLWNEEEGYHYWNDPDAENADMKIRVCSNCTNGAVLIAREFSGRVAGYEIKDNPNSKDLDPLLLVGFGHGGHDFAVVENYIIDWWGWEYDQSLEQPVLTIEEGIAQHRYLPEKLWLTVPVQDFRKK